jgi:hypothetical protein
MPLTRFIPAVFIFAAPVVMGAGQVEHAPTVAQCQADQRLWLSQIEAGASTATYGVLSNMAVEMNNFADVDPDNEKRYRNTMSESIATQELRLAKFVHRHQLWNKFLEEECSREALRGGRLIGTTAPCPSALSSFALRLRLSLFVLFVDVLAFHDYLWRIQQFQDAPRWNYERHPCVDLIHLNMSAIHTDKPNE